MVDIYTVHGYSRRVCFVQVQNGIVHFDHVRPKTGTQNKTKILASAAWAISRSEAAQWIYLTTVAICVSSCYTGNRVSNDLSNRLPADSLV